MSTQQSTEVEKKETTGEIYVITRGFQEGKQLTTAQKTSALFAEEPVVLGRVLRRGSAPMRLTGAEYRANEIKLIALEKAGAIKIQRPQEKAMSKPCSLCGQVPRGQGGEYKCPACGLPMVHDPADLNPGPAPEPEAAAAALDQQRAEAETAALAALEADNKAKELAAAEELKVQLKAAEEKANEAPVVPTEVPAPPPSAPKAAASAVEPAAEASSEVAPTRSDKKSHSSKKGKG